MSQALGMQLWTTQMCDKDKQEEWSKKNKAK